MTWPNGVVVQKSSIRKLPNKPIGGFNHNIQLSFFAALSTLST